MSAWIVPKEHIDVLVQAMVSWELILGSEATEVGRALWTENVKSIHSLYPDTEANDRDYPGPIDFVKAHAEEYEFEPLPGQVDPAVVETACRCYSYQSCEHPGWDQSRAYRLCTLLRSMATDRMAEFDQRFGPLGKVRLDSHAYAWGIEHRDVFEAAAALRRGAMVDA